MPLATLVFSPPSGEEIEVSPGERAIHSSPNECAIPFCLRYLGDTLEFGQRVGAG
jgi:hypothetical protein